jgi:hypothetical protein
LEQEKALVDEVYEEQRKVHGYGEYLQSIQDQNDILDGISIFGGQDGTSERSGASERSEVPGQGGAPEGSEMPGRSGARAQTGFAARNREKSAADYAGLTDENICFVPSKGVVSAMGAAWQDLFFVLFRHAFRGRPGYGGKGEEIILRHPGHAARNFAKHRRQAGSPLSPLRFADKFALFHEPGVLRARHGVVLAVFQPAVVGALSGKHAFHFDFGIHFLFRFDQGVVLVWNRQPARRFLYFVECRRRAISGRGGNRRNRGTVICFDTGRFVTLRFEIFEPGRLDENGKLVRGVFEF